MCPEMFADFCQPFLIFAELVGDTIIITEMFNSIHLL